MTRILHTARISNAKEVLCHDKGRKKERKKERNRNRIEIK